MRTQNDEPEDLTPEIMKQAHRDILDYRNTVLWMDYKLREFSSVLLSVMNEDG